MKALLFYRKEPQLSDYLGLGLFFVAYLAVIGLIFLPRVHHRAAATPPSSFAVEATHIAVGAGQVIR